MAEKYAQDLHGLSTEEVQDRIAQGLTNINTDIKTKSIPAILMSHIATVFNFINLGLALIIACTGQWRNLLFLSVVVFNTVIGVVQEVRAKLSVDRMRILTQARIRCIRDGKELALSASELVQDDLIILSSGDQIPADALVVQGHAAVDESMLTGESLAVEKSTDSELLSGSFIESGSVWARITHVGAESYAAKISAEAKAAKPINSQIMNSITVVLTLAVIILVPLGALLFMRSLHVIDDVNQALLSTAAALIGMIPQGFVLLTSTVLAVATLRLSKEEVLVQQAYTVETLARVDMICLDKTGTITTGAMQTEGVVDMSGAAAEQDSEVFRALRAVVWSQAEDLNVTAFALLQYLKDLDVDAPQIERIVPFASKRKYAGCMSSGHAYIMGAAQFIVGAERARELLEKLEHEDTYRVLMLAEVEGFDDEGNFVGEARPVGFVYLSDELRANAKEIIAYFKKQDVMIRVISGDDPATVSAIAQTVHIPFAEHYCDASQIGSYEELVEACKTNVIFGRVTPQQKRDLVNIFKSQGHTVAMTGDGVNDVLAMRSADCSISVASGTPAARNISEIVLVDSDFAHVPAIVAEGRRSINNLQRSGSLFLVKTGFTALIAALCVFLPPYPFLPIQMSLISFALIGVPSLVLGLEPNHELVKGKFLVEILSRSLPASISISIALALAILAKRAFHLDYIELSTMATVIACASALALMYQIAKPLNTLRRVLLVGVAVLVLLSVTFGRSFFRLAPFSPKIAILTALLTICSLLLFYVLFERSIAAAHSDTLYRKLLERLEHVKFKERGI